MSQDLDIKGYASLSSEVNKARKNGTEESIEGVVSRKLEELELEKEDSEIIALTKKWEEDWKNSPEKAEWEKQIEENEKYWLGKQKSGPEIDNEKPVVDNLIFESLETYLPQATRRNPEPVVTLDSSERDESGNESPEHSKYILKVKNKLADLADKNRIRLKLKKTGRNWAIYQLGVAKFGWDLDKEIPTVRILRPQRIILDPKATIDEDGYTGDRIGEYRKLTASMLLSLIGENASGDAKKKITEKVGDNLGTTIQFVEWWTPQYFCWKLDDTILLKKKNPHWNYDKTEVPNPEDMASEGVEVDTYGNVTTTELERKGINHFASPQMPYAFLSVFNLGDRPVDNTSLIQQNISTQNVINKRNTQIDKNTDDMNGGMVVSLERSGLTQPQAKNVARSLRKGGIVLIPSGTPRDAVDRYPAPSLPADVYNNLADMRTRLRDVFGVRGSSTAGLESESTVRGKILGRTMDSDRIGGGLTEFLEQFADDIYNWFVQLLYVYDAGFQFVQGAVPPKIVISVKEGSLLPKDSLSVANQTLELARMNKISNLDLFKRLEYPNPEELAANVWLEVNAPHLLFQNNPLVQQAMGMAQQQSAIAQGVIPQEQQVNPQERSILSEVPPTPRIE